MRLLEVTIYLYDKRSEEISGIDPEPSDDLKRRCFIDLDEVAVVWEGLDSGVVVLMKNRESFWLKDITIDKFVVELNSISAVMPNKVTGVCSGSSEPCVLCGGRVTQCGEKLTCEKCGFTTVPSSLNSDGSC